MTVTLNFGASKYLVCKFTCCQVFNNQVHSSITFTLWVILTETSGYRHLIRPNQYSPLPEWWGHTNKTNFNLLTPSPAWGAETLPEIFGEHRYDWLQVYENKINQVKWSKFLFIIYRCILRWNWNGQLLSVHFLFPSTHMH